MAFTGYHRPDADSKPVICTILKTSKQIRFILSVQKEANRDHHIVRGQAIPGHSVHGEFLNNLSGITVTGNRVREDTISWREHLLRSRHRLVKRSPAGFVGAGNITMNPGFTGFSEGYLYFVRGQDFGKPFPSVISCESGVGFESVMLDPVDPPSSDGLSGPQIILDGRPADVEQIAQMASEGRFYDLRHVIQLPRIILEEGFSLPGFDTCSIDIGMERFWREGQLDGKAVRRAIRGEVIDLDTEFYRGILGQIGNCSAEDALGAILKSQGYVESRAPSARGEWKLAGGRLHVVFHHGIYNHSVLGVNERGELVWMGLHCDGGRVGLTMADTAKLAAKHMVNGILVDNGGDVMCRLADEWVVPSVHSRERIRAILQLVDDPVKIQTQLTEISVRPLGSQP